MSVSRYNVMTYIKEATNVNAGQRDCREEIYLYFQRGTEQLVWVHP